MMFVPHRRHTPQCFLNISLCCFPQLSSSSCLSLALLTSSSYTWSAYWYPVLNTYTEAPRCVIPHHGVLLLHRFFEISSSGSNTESCKEHLLLGYKNQVRTSQETHYVSAINLCRLMLWKIWGFHGGDYEECSLLGYKNPVRTSQETHYFSTTESSQLMLCKIWGFHCSDYEECRLLRCYSLWLL
jgi:hypothetical protein